MRDNEFEKQVQEQLGGFKLRPSDAVWPKVQERIGVKKKRRPILIFFLLATLLIAGGYFYITNRNTQPVNASNNIATTDSETKNKQFTHEENHTLPGERHQPAPGAGSLSQKTTSANITGAGTAQNENNSRIVTAGNAVALKNKMPGNNPGEKKYAQKQNVLQQENFITSFSDAGSASKNKNDIRPTITGEEQLSLPGYFPLILIPAAEKPSAVAAVHLSTMPPDVLSVPLQNKSDKMKSRKQLEWGIEGAAGFANVYAENEKHILSTQPSALAANGFSAGPVIGPYQRGVRKPGFSFTAGLVLRKPVSQHSAFISGLRYSYLQNNLQQAATVSYNAGVNGIFDRKTEVVSTGEAYHYLSLPLVYEYNMAVAARKSISIQGGAAASYLFFNTSQVYNQQLNGVYEHNNAVVNKWQVHFTGGLFYTQQLKKGVLKIGPVVNAGGTQLFSAASESKRFPVFAGVAATWMLHKK